MKVKPARGPILWFLTTWGYGAITMPWSTVYVVPSRLSDIGLLAHEQAHVDQIQELGAIKFTVLYLWYNLRHGYENNPLELDARKRSGFR